MVTRRKPGGSGGPGGARPRNRGRFIRRRKVCAFCVEHVKDIDYKDVPRIRRYISDRFKMDPRRKTGVCAGHQRALSMAIKRARHLAMLPFPGSRVPV
jgi:small subunit ribosomal protein S18